MFVKNSLLPFLNPCTKCAKLLRLRHAVLKDNCDITYSKYVALIQKMNKPIIRHFQTSDNRYSAVISSNSRQPHIEIGKESSFIFGQNSHSALDSEDPKELSKDFLGSICEEIKADLNTSSKQLMALSHYLFDGKGKYMRPQIVYLLAVACNKTVDPLLLEYPPANLSVPIISETQKSICRIAEMIHTASLIHDDIIDGSGFRRGRPTINSIFGESKAVVAGDYVLSVASHCLAETGNPRVVEIISQIIEDLVRGEFMQLGTNVDETLRFNHYLEKTYKKTASLLANSCKAVAVLSGCNEDLIESAYQYGRNLGLAFQLVDDMLDFVSTSEAMGKPTSADLSLGLATAPVLFALDQHPDLAALIIRRFSQPGDVETALSCVQASNGISQTEFLATKFSVEAGQHLNSFVDSNHRRALHSLTDTMLHRKH